jgi:hypothetical protein
MELVQLRPDDRKNPKKKTKKNMRSSGAKKVPNPALLLLPNPWHTNWETVCYKFRVEPERPHTGFYSNKGPSSTVKLECGSISNNIRGQGL